MKPNLKSVWGLSAAHLVTDLYSPVLPAILPLLIAQYGYTYFLAGLIVSLYNITSSFAQPFVGWLYDRRGIAIHTSYSVLMSAFFISIIGLTDNYLLVLAFAALGALGHGIFHPGALGEVSRQTQDASRGRVTSYFVVGGNLGFALGPLFAGAVVGLMGLPGLVYLLIPGLVMAPLLRVILPPSGHTGRPDEAAAAPIRMGSMKPVVILVLATAFRAWTIFGSIAFLPTFLTDRGFDLITANILVSATLVAGIVGQIFGGAISDRFGRKEYTVFGLVGAVPAFYAFLMTDGFASIAALMLFGFSLWSTFSVTVAMGHEMMPGNVGLVSGLILGLAVGAGGLGVAITGYLADHISLYLGLYTLPLPVIVAVLLFLAVPYPWKALGRARRGGSGA
ncbi:MAG: MFS transporter [Methanomicrobiaceae archaeon]|nr:MFS transporter [Methanomicrobiaceae archaeon]